MSDVLIKISGLYKVFGKNPQEALAQVKAGKTKDELLVETSHTLGLETFLIF